VPLATSGRSIPLTVVSVLVLIASACTSATPPAAATSPSPAATSADSAPVPPSAAPAPADAAAFIRAAEDTLSELAIAAERAAWVQATYITHDTEVLAAKAQERLVGATVRLAKEAARFDSIELPADVRRKLMMLKLSLSTPAPSEPAKTAETTQLATRLESMYGAGKYCPQRGRECLDLQQLERIIARSRNPDSLLMAWRGWHSISPPMRDGYTRLAQLMNEGARELGFADVGALWRSNYDMSADEFAREVDRLWSQVEPLYNALHCFVRAALRQRYGANVVPGTGPIPAHLLGNMWAQEWGNIYDVVAPRGANGGIDVTERLHAKRVDARGMVKYGERFFTSLGFEPLPETFWERSLFVKPRDRDVVCHASAWDIDAKDDLRIKMCIDVTGEDFQTVHHELGHNFYQRAYSDLSYLYRDSANDGFHEAVGDAIALSVTPEYLKQVGLIDHVPPASQDIGILLRDALDRVAFLPFGLLVDQWRWKVFSGEVTPANYNVAWWELRERYQGVKAPVARGERDFDPGAKYHVPANVPYTRYFLARILQFQMHRALCEAAGFQGPLHRCSIYDNKEAGRRLAAMLEMGASRPWPEALEALTGKREMDATAIADYFAPLKVWLDKQNEGQACGWLSEG
ncbi:MAG TPA: M2 family metallopeptidase, partial [Gemmatimonadaceae bacterium]|nr:M2 family metallopeptidase [Gemmatimonadaceae bacterium]